MGVSGRRNRYGALYGLGASKNYFKQTEVGLVHEPDFCLLEMLEAGGAV